MIGCKGGKEGGDDGPAMGKEASKDTPRGMNLMAVYPALFNQITSIEDMQSADLVILALNVL